MGDVYTAMMQTANTTAAPLSNPRLQTVDFTGNIDLEQLKKFDAVRFQLLSRACEQRMQTHLITSAVAKEGRTTCVISLGLAFAQMPQTRVLLIETDLASPSFDRWFAFPSKPAGLASFLEGHVQNLDDIMYEVQLSGKFPEPEASEFQGKLPGGLPGELPGERDLCVCVIPAGIPSHASSSTLLADPKMSILLNRCKDLFDHVVLDSPPLDQSHDACVVGRLCDESVLAVALHRTPGPKVDRAKSCLVEHGCDIAGVVLV